MRNALTPVITLGALEFGTLLSGAVLTEQIFTIPGFGKLIVDAVFNRDYAVVQGVVLVTATTYIVLNLLGRHRLHPGQPAAAGRERGRPLPSCASSRAAAGRTRREPRRAARWRRLRRRAGAMVGARGHRARSSLRRAPRAAHRALRPDRAELVGRAQAALRRALVRHRRGRARPPLAHHLRRPRLALGRRDLGRASRSRVGVPLGLLAGYAGGLVDGAASAALTDAMLACPFLILAIALAAFLGPEPRQRDDRHRRHRDADLRPAHARPGARRQGRGLRRGGARRRQPALAHRARATSCRTCCRRSSCRRRSPSPPPSSPRRACPSSASASSRRRRPGARMLNSAQRFLANAPWMAVWPGARDLRDRAVLQPPRRRPARRPRPALEMTPPPEGRADSAEGRAGWGAQA